MTPYSDPPTALPDGPTAGSNGRSTSRSTPRRIGGCVGQLVGRRPVWLNLQRPSLDTEISLKCRGNGWLGYSIVSFSIFFAAQSAMSSSPSSSSATPGNLESAALSEKVFDPNLVDWDSDDDPENPRNWPTRTKWANIVIISILALITYVLNPFIHTDRRKLTTVFV